MPNTVICIVVTALWYEGKQRVNSLAIKRIHDRIGDEDFSEVLKQIDKMPAWMRKVFVWYQSMQPDDLELKEDLNLYYQG
jgi:hypothetical protein